MKRMVTAKAGRLLCALLVSITTTRAILAHAQEHEYKLRNISVSRGERVVGIHLALVDGSFVSLSPLPMGWYLTIDNDPSQQTSLSGNARVGAAALEAPELLGLKIRTRKVESGAPRYSLAGTLVVTRDFNHERRIRLRPENFLEVRGRQ